jgi:hypothetical protein
MSAMRADSRGSPIRRICGGEDTEAVRSSCRFFDSKNQNCLLVREQRLSEAFGADDNCFSLLNACVDAATTKISRSFQSFYTETDSEELDLAGLILDLRRASLESQDLRAWISYVQTAAFRAVRLSLVRRGLMPKIKSCNTCRYLSPLDVCHLQEIIDAPRARMIENRYHGLKRNRTDKPCDGYEPHKPERVWQDDNSEWDTDPLGKAIAKDCYETQSISGLDFSLILQSVEKRIDQARTPNERRIRKEQHALFMAFCRLVYDGYSEAEAKEQLIEDLNPSSSERGAIQRRINRYLSDIRQFLREGLNIA